MRKRISVDPFWDGLEGRNPNPSKAPHYNLLADPPLQGHSKHFSVEQRSLCFSVRSLNSAWKRRDRDRRSSEQRVRLLQPLFSSSKERQGHQTNF